MTKQQLIILKINRKIHKDLLKQLGCRKSSSFLGILKPAISFWLVIFLLLQIIAGVLFYPPIQEAEAA